MILFQILKINLANLMDTVNIFFQGIKSIPIMPDVSGIKFGDVIELPEKVPVLDLSNQNSQNKNNYTYSIGKYNEKRPGMYLGQHYEKTHRNIHMGIDIGAPVGTPVYSFYDGEIFLFDYNDGKLDYGYTLIIKHVINNVSLFALYGHLDQRSIKNKKVGEHVSTNDEIAFIGSSAENGGWPPHLHFQLSLVEPKECDLPGVVSDLDKENALKVFPDPRLVLGNIY